MKKNLLSISFITLSLICGALTLAIQNSLTIISFLLLFYLIPMLFFAIGCALFKERYLSLLLKAGIGGVVFTAVYTLIFYLNIIDFNRLFAQTTVEGVQLSAVNMDISSLLNTFITVAVMILISQFIVDKLRNYRSTKRTVI